DPAGVLGAARIAKLTDERSRTARDALIDWPHGASAKYALLRRLWDDFAAKELRAGGGRAADFLGFVREGGERLREHALFEALHGHSDAAPEPTRRGGDWPAPRGRRRGARAGARQRSTSRSQTRAKSSSTCSCSGSRRGASRRCKRSPAGRVCA